jgi:hypothetical protein
MSDNSIITNPSEFSHYGDDLLKWHKEQRINLFTNEISKIFKSYFPRYRDLSGNFDYEAWTNFEQKAIEFIMSLLKEMEPEEEKVPFLDYVLLNWPSKIGLLPNQSARIPKRCKNSFNSILSALIGTTKYLIRKSESSQISEPAINGENSSKPSKKIKWRQINQLPYIFEQAINKGLIIGVAVEDRYDLIVEHFCQKDGKDINKKSLQTSYNNTLKLKRDRKPKKSEILDSIIDDAKKLFPPESPK